MSLRSLRTRLDKLRAAQVAAAHDPYREWQERQRWDEAHRAWLAGGGVGPRPADPPCPEGFDKAIWAARMRQCHATDSLILNGGDLSAVVFPPDTPQSEKDDFIATIEELWRLCEEYPIGPGDDAEVGEPS